MIIDEQDYLEHHGVLGMKWGIRHDPKAKQARREAKAKKYTKRAAVYQAEIDRKIARGRRHGIGKLREKQASALDDAQRKREGKLSKGQKHLVEGAAAAATIAAAYGTYHSLNSGNARRLMEKGKAFITRDKSVTPWKLNPELNKPGMDTNEIYTNVVKHINPDFGAPGTKMNCRRATYAYEMRRRGYDVAATRTLNGLGQDITGNYNVLNPGINLVPPGRSGIISRGLSELIRKPANQRPFTDILNKSTIDKAFQLGQTPVHPNNIFKDLNKMPDGARGELGMRWFSGGAHSMAWEKIKDKVVIFDNQSGDKYEVPAQFEGIRENITDAAITRLDHIPLNNDFLTRWLKNA